MGYFVANTYSIILIALVESSPPLAIVPLLAGSRSNSAHHSPPFAGSRSRKAHNPSYDFTNYA
jgi:hypothetical protein